MSTLRIGHAARRAGAPGEGLGGALGLAVLAAVALVVGAAAAVVGSAAGPRSMYYVAIFSLAGLAVMLAATRKEPLRFAFLALIACFPLLEAEVPPGRLGLTVFNVGAILLGLGLVGKKLINPRSSPGPVFPSASLLTAWLLLLPCVLFSRYPAHSFIAFFLIFGVYAFFLLAMEELRRENGFEHLVTLLALVSIVFAAGLFVDSTLHLNLSMRGANVNQNTMVGGVPTWRAAGFFQDPQQAGGFLASIVTFLLVLSVRGRFRGKPLGYLVWLAILCGLAALTTTISRSAIIGCIVVSFAAIFAFNGWSIVTKLVIMVAVVALAVLGLMTPWEVWLNFLPVKVVERFLDAQTEFQDRLNIWFDTWDMFANHPLFGIGPGSFQPYLAETRPTVTYFYGIGEAEGVPYVPYQPESGYLKILYEGGIVGSAAALLVIGDALRRVAMVTLGRNADPRARTECIAALAGLIAFAVTFVTLFNLGDGRIAGIFCVFLAVIWHHSLSLSRAASPRVVKVRNGLKNDPPLGRIGTA